MAGKGDGNCMTQVKGGREAAPQIYSSESLGIGGEAPVICKAPQGIPKYIYGFYIVYTVLGNSESKI